MNKLGVILLTTFIVIVSLKINKCIASSEDDLFHTLNNKLNHVINKLYKTTRDNKTLVESKKTRLLLTMREDLNKLKEINLKSYKDIENAIKTSDTDAINYLNKLNVVIKKVLKDKHVVTNKNLNEIEEESIEMNDTSIESLQFYKNSLNNLNEETSEDIINSIIKPVHKYKNISFSEFRKSKRSNTYNLKLWNGEIKKSINRRIFDGKTTDIRKYPFIVSIHVMEEFVCAGSIISKDLIITAASCLVSPYKHKNYQDELGDITVRAGSDYTNRGGEQLSISEIIFHPTFDPTFLLNNLAIARINTEFRFMTNRRRIRRIQYAGNEDYLDAIKMMGWGIKDDTGIIARNHESLLSTELSIYKLNSCKDIYSRHFVTNKNFCAGFPTKGGGACKRDVGGPGVVRGVLVGVVSFGPPVCGTPGAPTVFTKLGFYIDWIDSVVKKSSLRDNDLDKNTNDNKQTGTDKNLAISTQIPDPTKKNYPPSLQTPYAGSYFTSTVDEKKKDESLSRIEKLENLIFQYISEKGDFMRNEGKHNNSAFTLTTKAMTKEIATKNSTNIEKEILDNDSDNYEVEDDSSQGFSSEREVTQIENGIGSTKSIAISTLYYKAYDSADEKVLISKTMPKKDDSSDDSDEYSEKKRSHERRSILDYINIR